jgi:hypothetical protein
MALYPALTGSFIRKWWFKTPHIWLKLSAIHKSVFQNIYVKVILEIYKNYKEKESKNNVFYS